MSKPAEQPAQAAGAQPAQTAGEQPANNAETKTAEQPAQTTGAQPAQNAEGQQAQAADGKAAEQPAAAQQKPTARRGADVATVQYYLQSALPDSNIVADGILGPKTITAIQQKEDIDTTGKMDKPTQDAFNKLLAEAKKKVIPLQEKLGVTADGLIGKQTLAAMNKANMNVANLFSKQPSNEAYAAKQSAPSATQANAAENQTDKKLTSHPFDKERADFLLQQKSITQQAYNIWKNFGIAPLMQKKMPNETKAFIARAQQAKKNEAQVDSRPTENIQPQNEEEKKFFDKMKENYLKVYTVSAQQKGKSEGWANNMAQHAAEEALTKKRNGTWGKTQPQANQQQAVAQGNPKQAQPAKQTQQAAAAPQNNQNAQGNNEVYKRTQDAKGTTEYYSGNLSLYNLSKEEENLRDQAEAKEQAKYIDSNNQIKKNPNTGKPYNEQMILERVKAAGEKAVVDHRMAKARARQG